MVDHKETKEQWIRGVNIGGWLVLERFITPYFFALTDCHLRGDFHFYPGQVDAPPTTSPMYKPMDKQALANCKPVQPYPVEEYTLTKAFSDKSIAKAYMEVHWDNHVKREDITKLKEAGVTHVRVPLGHWIMGDIRDDEPWVDGGWAYFKRLVGWCREENIQVWPDIHTAPGSQNGFDNSGLLRETPTCHGWDMDNASAVDDDIPTTGKVQLSNNVLRSLKAVDDITKAIAAEDLGDVVTGFGILNEPFANCDPRVIRKFDNMALDIVRRNMGEEAHIYIGDTFDAAKFNDGFWTAPQYKDTYLDSHYYHVFDERPRHLSPRQHIALVCQHNREQVTSCCYEDEGNKTIPSKGISRIIGEWSASFDTLVCSKLDVVMASIAADGVASEFNRTISPPRQAFLRNFVEAQMVTYEALSTGVSSGWFYWTFKMEGGAFAEWDFLRGHEEGWIPSIPEPDVDSRDLYGTCYDIIFKTDDDMSIVHEFPDPKSIDLKNWQGFNIDDDVVVTHGQSLKMDADGDWFNPKKPTLDQHGLAQSAVVIACLLCVVGMIRLLKKSCCDNRDGYTSIEK